MGSYLNPDSSSFKESLSSEIYVDKSGIISYLNSVIRTKQKYVCVSRPRRFGKSMTVNMLTAYYGCEEDTDELFVNFKIGADSSYQTHLNKYEVIHLDMQEFLSLNGHINQMLDSVQRNLLWELKRKFSKIDYYDSGDLVSSMRNIYAETKCTFIILIDEWDCIFREYKEDIESQRAYLDFLRAWLKDKPYVALAYMTGILPIKKYGTHSALNMFDEFSMVDPGKLAEYVGFTGEEVRDLCDRYAMSFEESKAWYDGYFFEHAPSVYSPKSVVTSMLRKKFDTYWNQTETYEALKIYIQMDFDGLKNAIVKMLAGGSIKVNTTKFSNDMTTFTSKDDVLTLLVHLGYLAYDERESAVSIPNKEVSGEYVNAMEGAQWDEVVKAVNASEQLLKSLWNLDGTAVAAGIDDAHMSTSILQYNDENALSYAVNLAFYSAREYYTIIREFPSGRGFADICFVPRPNHTDKPAMVIELKWDKSAEGAIAQIKNKQYIKSLEAYHGNLLLVGINYSKEDTTHECVIEKVRM